MATLVTVAEAIEHPEDTVASFHVQNSMARAGFTKIATALALKALVDKGLLTSSEEEHEQDHYQYLAYSVTNGGMNWLAKNEHIFILRRTDPPEEAISDDDVPF